jgi:hypothetical protein
MHALHTASPLCAFASLQNPPAEFNRLVAGESDLETATERAGGRPGAAGRGRVALCFCLCSPRACVRASLPLAPVSTPRTRLLERTGMELMHARTGGRSSSC